MATPKICGIYKITSPTGKIYIGQSVDVNRRLRQYKSGDCKFQTRLKNSLNKHGAENHTFEVLELCNECDLNEREVYYIETLGTFNTHIGLNLRSGSTKGKMSDETKALISKNNARHNLGKKASPETREKIRQARLRQADPNLGKKRSPEICAKFKILNTGRVTSDETKKKISDSLKNSAKLKATMNSSEYKAKMSAIHKGKIGHKYWLGKERSDKTKELLRIANTGKKQSLESIEKRIETRKRNKINNQNANR